MGGVARRSSFAGGGAGDPRDRLLRGADARPRTLSVPVLRGRGDPAGHFLAMARRLRDPGGRQRCQLARGAGAIRRHPGLLDHMAEPEPGRNRRKQGARGAAHRLGRLSSDGDLVRRDNLADRPGGRDGGPRTDLVTSADARQSRRQACGRGSRGWSRARSRGGVHGTGRLRLGRATRSRCGRFIAYRRRSALGRGRHLRLR